MIVLASKSASRRAMLDAAGVPHEAIPAELDERSIEAGLAGCPPHEVAEALSLAKAQAVAAQRNGRLVLGSDSLVVCNGVRFDKPASLDQAAEHLRRFSGQVMELHSAAALVRDNCCEWSGSSLARLTVRELSDDFIDSYLAAEWPEVGHCVGVFRIEGLGVQLFKAIEGDQFTVLGMPLLGVLAALRELGELPA
ncbi:MAG: Maf family protein [Erythrobacter sp.]